MKTTIIVNRTRRLPLLGEYWHFDGQKNIFQRIRNDQGEKVFPHSPADSFFYSIDIVNGTLYTTNLEDINEIEILETVDEVIKFRPI